MADHAEMFARASLVTNFLSKIMCGVMSHGSAQAS
jgi:hypothetical protein